MVSRLAFSILSADIWQAAHIHALVIDTGTAERTVRVGNTFQLQTADIWVALGSENIYYSGFTDINTES